MDIKKGRAIGDSSRLLKVLKNPVINHWRDFLLAIRTTFYLNNSEVSQFHPFPKILHPTGDKIDEMNPFTH